MNAVLTVELEVLEPVLVDTAEGLLQLHPSQIRWIAIRLTTPGDEGGADAAVFSAQSADSRVAVRALVDLAQGSQPGGTAVVVWYQGRSESFVI